MTVNERCGNTMGASGYGTFDDDTAMDWLAKLAVADDSELLGRSLTPEGADEYLPYDAAVGILAAAEIVYGILNGPREGLPKEALAWIAANKAADVACLKPVCERQLGCVLSEHSELRQRRQQNKELYPAWKKNIEALRDALKD